MAVTLPIDEEGSNFRLDPDRWLGYAEDSDDEDPFSDDDHYHSDFDGKC